MMACCCLEAPSLLRTDQRGLSLRLIALWNDAGNSSLFVGLGLAAWVMVLVAAVLATLVMILL